MSALLQSIVTLASLFVAIAALYFSNKNSRRQLKVGKLEELFQTMLLLDRYYSILMPLYHTVMQLRDPEDKSITTMADYYKERDILLPEEKRNNLIELSSRVDVLAECYASSPLKDKIKKYSSLIFAISDLAINGGSIYQAVHFNEGFPGYDDFYKMSKEIRNDIVAEIKK